MVTWHFSIDNVVNCGYLFSMSKYDSFHRLPPWILCFFSFRVQMGWYSYLTMQNLETLKGIASWCHILEFGLTMYLFLPQLGIFSGTSCLSPSANPDDILTWVAGIDVFCVEPMLLGHIHENHYDSFIQWVGIIFLTQPHPLSRESLQAVSTPINAWGVSGYQGIVFQYK